jgi:lipopolysaccharide/colanic/teichoic acid biosynthesis glycosyltransferase
MLIVCAPLIVVTAVLIKLDSQGPVFFSQERVGEKGKIYRIHKFRSMAADAEKQSGPVWAQSDDDRITRVGNIIRRLRIDEIPQLYNVLKGEMSFVGPRPEREFFVKQLEDLIPYYAIRYTVKPGITGWAQVCYGYGASVEDAVEKLNYDLFYIKNMTTLMDFMIVLQTIKIVLFSKGAR